MSVVGWPERATPDRFATKDLEPNGALLSSLAALIDPDATRVKILLWLAASITLASLERS